jgi:hypothetical protein
METNGCILLASDGSTHLLKAMDGAIRIPKELQTKLIVLHANWGEDYTVNIGPKEIPVMVVDTEALKMVRKLDRCSHAFRIRPTPSSNKSRYGNRSRR